MRRPRPTTLAVVCAGLVAAATVHAAPMAQNVIIVVGDGMGIDHVKAASLFATGTESGLNFQQAPYYAEMTTHNRPGLVTDSAASATAMATGAKVINSTISVAQPPPDGSGLVWGDPLPTTLENLAALGKSTGLVTTSYITDATPAAFGSHTKTRSETGTIASWYLSQNRPNVLLGGGANGMSIAAAQAAGYTVVTDAAELAAVNPAVTSHLSGQFGAGLLPYSSDGLGALPSLPQMAAKALDMLDDDPDGFFLLLENENIDEAGHNNDLPNVVNEVLQLAATVQVVLDWMAGRGVDDTMLLVLADHNTGGLIVTADNGIGVLPTVTWAGENHTLAHVPVYAWGPNAGLVAGTIDNTDIFRIARVPEPASAGIVACGITLMLMRRRR